MFFIIYFYIKCYEKKIDYSYFFKGIILPLFLYVSVLSCDNDIADDSGMLTEKPEKKADEGYRVSVDEAQETLFSFLEAEESSTDTKITTRSLKTKKIKNVQAIRNNKQVSTYSISENLSVDIDTLMYLLNFEDNEGFALVAADKRTDAIYAIINKGSLSVDTIERVNNPGFRIFMDNAKTKILTDIANFDDDNGFALENKEKKVYRSGIPIVDEKLQTKWGQDYPYNKYCPSGYPTGCVITATAQILSYFQTIQSVQYTNNGTSYSSPLNWSQIITDCKNNGGMLFDRISPTSSMQVAHLMRYLGITFDASYGPSGTGAVSSTAVRWLKLYGGLPSTTNLYAFRCEDIYPALMSNKLIYARANDVTTGSGHAWVIDAIVIYHFDSTRPPYYFLHCNWGWEGYCDGYYLDGVFDSDSYVDGNAQQGNGSIRYKFNHNVQMAIVGK